MYGKRKSGVFFAVRPGFQVSFLEIETLRFFVFERTKHQPRRNLRSYLVLQRLCNEAALSPGIDAFLY